MAEDSTGKQPVKTHKPSRLNQVQQAPESDTVISEAQLAVDEDDPEHEDCDDPEALALIARCTIKKPGGSATAPSQASANLSQSVTLTRPSSAKSTDFTFLTATFNKAPYSIHAPTVKPSFHCGAVVSYVDLAAEETLDQGTDDVRDRVPLLTIQKMSTPVRYHHPGYKSPRRTSALLRRRPLQPILCPIVHQTH